MPARVSLITRVTETQSILGEAFIPSMSYSTQLKFRSYQLFLHIMTGTQENSTLRLGVQEPVALGCTLQFEVALLSLPPSWISETGVPYVAQAVLELVVVLS